MTAVPRNVHLLDSRGRLNAGDYVVLCWPVLERLTTAVQQCVLVRLGTSAAACGS